MPRESWESEFVRNLLSSSYTVLLRFQKELKSMRSALIRREADYRDELHDLQRTRAKAKEHAKREGSGAASRPIRFTSSRTHGPRPYTVNWKYASPGASWYEVDARLAMQEIQTEENLANALKELRRLERRRSLLREELERRADKGPTPTSQLPPEEEHYVEGDVGPSQRSEPVQRSLPIPDERVRNFYPGGKKIRSDAHWQPIGPWIYNRYREVEVARPGLSWNRNAEEIGTCMKGEIGAVAEEKPSPTGAPWIGEYLVAGGL